jgi:hypothetical protein
VRAAGQHPQAGGGLVDDLGLRQDAPPDCHHGVGGEDEGLAQVLAVTRRLAGDLRLRPGEALHELPRRFRFQRRLIHIRRQQRVGLDPRLLQERKTTRASRSQDELRTPSLICAARNHETGSPENADAHES